MSKKNYSKALLLQGFFIAIIALSACENESNKVEETILEEQEIPNDDLQFSDVSNAKFTAYFDSISKYDHFNGVALLYQNDSVWKYKSGKPRFEENDTFRFDDVFQLASVSKPITAFGVLKLFEQKQRSIYEPVKNFLPLFPDEKITIYQLLTHTSGLGNYIYSTDSLWAKPDSVLTNAEVCCYFEEGLIPTYHPPGKTFDYCNSNYALLANVIEELSGLTFRDYMQKEVFGPLKMENTAYQRADVMSCLDYRVYGHYPDGNYKQPFYLNGVVGDKGLYSSVEDLLKFFKELQSPTLVSDSLLNFALSPLEKANHGNYYGLGWRVKEIDADTVIFHNGWWRGFRTYFWFDSQRQKAIIVLTNTIAGGYLEQPRIWKLM